jgi:hypothetical protein
VTLEVVNFPGQQSLSRDDQKFLKDGPFRNLPLHPSARNVKSALIHGCQGGPSQHVRQRLQAGHPVRLSLELQFDPHETKGAVHAFNVVQKGANGHVQGGIRVLAVMDH